MAYSYSTTIKYAVRFHGLSAWGLNFTQFSKNCLSMMKYCSEKDFNIMSSCENVIQHTIKEQGITLVKWKTNSPSQMCNMSILRNHPWQSTAIFFKWST